MAALALRYPVTPSNEVLSVATLRDWLHGRWALLFSHPDDFASYGFEMDRWLVHVEKAFADASISPLSIAGKDGAETSWVSEAGGGTVSIRWSDAHRAGGAMRHRERSLISTVLAQTGRFVLILDESLRPRLTYSYSPGDSLPSPIDLGWMAHRIRERLGR